MSDVPVAITIDDITINDSRRAVNSATVKKLAQSIEAVGLQHPITVKRKDGGYLLIAGRHRLEACKKLGRDYVVAGIVTMTKDEARLWEISENLHRAKLSNIEKAEAIEEWRKLTARKVVNRSPPSGGKQPSEVGARKTAEALGVDHATVLNARKIASIGPDAKAAATESGITTVRELVEVSKENPERQIAKVHELAEKRARPADVPDDDDDGDDSEAETATPAEKIDAFLVSSYEAMLMARYEGPFDKRVLESAQKTAAAWRQIAQRLRICLDDPVRAVG